MAVRKPVNACDQRVRRNLARKLLLEYGQVRAAVNAWQKGEAK